MRSCNTSRSRGCRFVILTELNNGRLNTVLRPHRLNSMFKQVFVLPGLLTLTNFAKPDVIRRGGPLGELMQWADLIAGCFALCHSLAVRYHINGAIHEYACIIYSSVD